VQELLNNGKTHEEISRKIKELVPEYASSNSNS